jgi:hypothetical protein
LRHRAQNKADNLNGSWRSAVRWSKILAALEEGLTFEEADRENRCFVQPGGFRLPNGTRSGGGAARFHECIGAGVYFGYCRARTA